MRFQILYSLLVGAAVVISCAPCNAQSVAVTSTALENGISRTTMRPGVRYTTGTYVVTPPGFEKRLVQGDHNLGHWNWSPVVGYSQGSLRTSKQANPLPAPAPERKSIYIKPNHIAMPVVDHSIRLAAKPELLKPVVHKSAPIDGGSSRHSETDTSLVLSYKTNNPYRGEDTVRTAARVHGMLVHQSVGAILSQSMQY